MAQNPFFKKIETDLMPYGNRFESWEQPVSFTKTYHVNNQHPKASDENPGTVDRPFRTINAAAQVVKAGERVAVATGTYRECIRPKHAGAGPTALVSFEAAPGAEVIVKGSFVLDPKGWKKGEGWRYEKGQPYPKTSAGEVANVWQYDFDGAVFGGYNPFGMLNIQHDREWLDYRNVKMEAHFRRRGMLFLNGKPLEQVEKSVHLSAKKEGAFWIEHNGLRIHVRFPDGKTPADFEVEATRLEQLFCPPDYGMGYIQLKGITFRHAGNGFPVPQRGMVSANRGHHFILEDCRFDWANSLGVDLGNEMWDTQPQAGRGYHIVRRCQFTNCGLSGLQGNQAPHYLIEDNWFENIGWQDAEHGFEAGAIKLHGAEHTLIRRNVFKQIIHAPGIWLDYLSNQNCRLTQNVFTGLTTARGAIYVEVSHHHCFIDHNVFHDLHSQYWISGDYGAGGSGLYTDGSDSITFFNNLVFDIENTGYGSYFNAQRIVGQRGGISRFQVVRDNIFLNCQRHSIEFPNPYNFSNGNLFGQVRPGYLKIAHPEPALLLDLPTWQQLFGWEQDGRLVQVAAELDAATLQLTLRPEKGLPLGPGPFTDLYRIQSANIDPRRQ